MKRPQVRQPSPRDPRPTAVEPAAAGPASRTGVSGGGGGGGGGGAAVVEATTVGIALLPVAWGRAPPLPLPTDPQSGPSLVPVCVVVAEEAAVVVRKIRGIWKKI